MHLVLEAGQQRVAYDVMQMVNQTYNAGLNYGNRNTSSEYTTTDLARGYFGAVAASMTIAFATRKALAP